MKEGNKTVELNSTKEEKDLGVLITRDLKFHEHMVSQSRKLNLFWGWLKDTSR